MRGLFELEREVGLTLVVETTSGDFVLVSEIVFLRHCGWLPVSFVLLLFVEVGYLGAVGLEGGCLLFWGKSSPREGEKDRTCRWEEEG